MLCLKQPLSPSGQGWCRGSRRGAVGASWGCAMLTGVCFQSPRGQMGKKRCEVLAGQSDHVKSFSS